jgi:hypothetical protein
MTMAETYVTLAERIEKYACPPIPGGYEFSRAELRALHSFKGKFAAAFRELYKTVPAEPADKFIAPLLRRLSESV